MVSCAHLSVALRVALGASTWPGKRGFTIRRSSPTQRRNGRAFSSLTARGGGLPIGVTHGSLIFTAVFKICKFLNLLKLGKQFFISSPIVSILGGSWVVIVAVFIVLFRLNFSQNRPFLPSRNQISDLPSKMSEPYAEYCPLGLFVVCV